MATPKLWPTPEIAVRSTVDLGEGPVWDIRTNRLCWVDLLGGVLHEDDLEDGSGQTTATGTLLGAAAPREAAEGFGVAVREGFGLLAGGVLTLEDAVLSGTDHRMNDAKCDSRGRLWAGSLSTSGASATGALWCWSGGASSRRVLDGFDLPNGIGWSPDDRLVYLVDSLAHAVLVAPFDSDDGRPGEFTELVRVDGGLPDGLAIDINGNLWVAVWDGSEIHCFSSNGELIGVVPMPVTRPTSCSFGPDGTLYITTARTGLSPEVLQREPEAGSVFALATSTTGVTVHPFAA